MNETNQYNQIHKFLKRHMQQPPFIFFYFLHNKKAHFIKCASINNYFILIIYNYFLSLQPAMFNLCSLKL